LQQASARVNNDTLQAAASSGPQDAGMGASIVMALVQKDTVVIAHTGDSRAYLSAGTASRA